MSAPESTPPDSQPMTIADIPQEVRIPLTVAGFSQCWLNLVEILDMVSKAKRTAATLYMVPVNDFLIRCRAELFPGVIFDEPSNDRTPEESQKPEAP